MISAFTAQFRFLSNFSPGEVAYEGDIYPTVEHAFQAAKTLDATEREKIRTATSPATAKRLGRAAKLRDGWDDMRIDVMRELLQCKFAAGTPLAYQLLATGTEQLVEGNWWGDRFWGVCEGRGENHLGRLLMEIRAELASISQ